MEFNLPGTAGQPYRRRVAWGILNVQAPTIGDLLRDLLVLQALEDAWQDSVPADATRRHEEGGWVYMDTTSGELFTRRARAGRGSLIDLSAPPLVPGAVVVATFHTHPNPGAEGWETGPSADDTRSAWAAGVPCLIRADDGTYATGPDSRRGGPGGCPGFPH
jgi:hypothetical protein